jgi:catechol 2,3-dioxygenase-like lactoylglutathione lyase family enzyme
MIQPIQGDPVAFVYVADRGRAVAWYRDVLGCELRGSDDFGDFFRLGGALLRMTALPEWSPTPHPVLGWNVPDIAGVVKTLRAQGVRFSIYAGMGQDELGIWTAPDGNAKVAWFTDSEGNVLSLSQS